MLWCTVARGLTVPGQTAGVSVFTDDLIESLGTSRSGVSTAYSIGTLSGAIALPAIGRWVDRVGVRHAMSVITVLFAVVIAATSTVQNVVMLGFAFVGLRMLGQGALSLTGSTGITLWFDKRRGFALALSGVGVAAMLNGAPLAIGRLINQVGWRWAWVVLAAIVAVVLIPIARFLIVDRPEDIGQLADGARLDDPEAAVRQRSWVVSEVLHSPAFWTLGALNLVLGAFVTGLTFHNEDIMGLQGLTETQAQAVFIPFGIGMVVASFVAGSLTDRMPAKPLMVFGGVATAAGVFLATTASPGFAAVVYGIVVGVSVGTIPSITGALLPKWYGIDHIGSIRGVATMFGIGGAALGPLLFSIGNDISDSYEPILVISAGVALAVALLAALVPTPQPDPLPVSD